MQVTQIRSLPFVLIILIWSSIFGTMVAAQKLPTIENKTAEYTKMDGFFPVYWDADAGKIWLEIPSFNEDFLYAISLPAGIGSNDIGLDRSQLGGQRVVHFERIGPKVLLVEPNLRFRATTDNEAERLSVRDAFAGSVVWGFTVAAESNNRVLVDATDFVVRDAYQIVIRLRGSGQGTFKLDARRSAPFLDYLKAFPENSEMEALLTFTSENPGRYVRDVAADAYAVSVRIRHSFIKLPPPGYTPRVSDPRSGYFGIEYVDFAAPIGEQKEKRFISRHRLDKKNPDAAISEPVEPIVYYLDPGTPEPVRSALLEGAGWWSEAFEAAGFRDAYRVEVLPDDADPMDARYNVIQWVHRKTRGWSYGSTITDPRTGEIIKGHVSLGSQRIRQDYLIAQGLLSPFEEEHTHGYDEEDDPMLKMALARIRQLSVHEVGHTLGLSHNFAASVFDRASVMDYPAPLVRVTPEGEITLNDAYDTGVGSWDVFAIRYGYSAFPDSIDERAALNDIIENMYAEGLQYITDEDARAPGAAHMLSNLWDNGADMIEQLEQEMTIRDVALSRFGETSIREGQPLALLEEVLVPLYLRHRYQSEATAKMIGGVSYSYNIRGDSRSIPEPVPGSMQEEALEALLNTVQPAALRLPEAVRKMIPPRPPGYSQHRELFGGYSGLTFDPYAPAEVAAGMVLNMIVQPERAARIVYQHQDDASLPDLEYVLTQTSDALWTTAAPLDPYDAELQRITQQVWIDALLTLATNDTLAPSVRASVHMHLRDLHAWMNQNPGSPRDRATVSHRVLVFDQLDRYLFRIYRPDETHETITTPPGAPIGQAGPDFLQRQRIRRERLETWSSYDGWCGFEH